MKKRTKKNGFAAAAGTRSLGSYAMSSSTANRRRHSVASQPITAINSQSVNVTTTTTPTLSSTIGVLTTSNNNNTTTTSTTMIITPKSHQRTLSLPLAAVAINQTQSSKRSVLRCMYFLLPCNNNKKKKTNFQKTIDFCKNSEFSILKQDWIWNFWGKELVFIFIKVQFWIPTKYEVFYFEKMINSHFWRKN